MDLSEQFSSKQAEMFRMLEKEQVAEQRLARKHIGGILCRHFGRRCPHNRDVVDDVDMGGEEIDISNKRHISGK